ncbi:MAG: ABC transporter substrate-binding protein [Candidatus Glassbacteria bacterium]|nr:ABC transporter substrate-binding protein [Candidatus Glassbacteria bacterium]
MANKAVYHLLLSLAAALPVLLCCSTGSAGRGGTLQDGKVVFRLRIPGDPPSLDPIHSVDLVSQAVACNLFDPLVRLDPETGSVVPCLAAAWETADSGLTFRFLLRRDVRFHNGRRVVAADVRYSFERLLDPASAGKRPWILLPLRGAQAFRDGRAGAVEGIGTAGDSLVVLRLEKPFAPFLVQLTMVGASIVPREEVERADRADFGEHPVGSGPFRFVEWRHDSRILLERSVSYPIRPRPPAGVDLADFVVVPNVSVAFEKYRAGELDLLDQLPPGQVALSRKRLADQLHIWPGLSVRYLGFNLTRQPFKDNRLLRRAFNYAVNKRAICEVLGEGVDVVSTGAVPPGLAGHNGELEGYPYDPAMARELLARAGYPGGRGLGEVTLLYNNDPADRRVCEFIQACLSEIGVEVRLKSLEWAAFLAAIRAGESQLFRGSWIGDFPDAHNFLYTLFSSENWGDAGNYTRFADRAVDSLCTLALEVVDQARRAALYREVESIVSDESPWIFLYHPGQVALLKPYWRGAAFPAVGIWAFPLAGVWLDRGRQAE